MLGSLVLALPLLLLLPQAASAHGKHVQVTEFRTYTDINGSWQELVFESPPPIVVRWCRWHAVEQDVAETRYLTQHIENGVMLYQEQTRLDVQPLGPRRESTSWPYQC